MRQPSKVVLAPETEIYCSDQYRMLTLTVCDLSVSYQNFVIADDEPRR